MDESTARVGVITPDGTPWLLIDRGFGLSRPSDWGFVPWDGLSPDGSKPEAALGADLTTRGIIRLVEPATGVAVAFCRINLEDHPRWRDAAVRRERIGVIVADMLSYDYAKDKDEYLRIDGAELGICRLAIRLTPDGGGIATIY